ncbi:PepSY domain-containing protein [Tunturibacter empetritectus]|uniref:PepSY domain-containing protein n=1 Tax=Tunturiibacter empetritectus TaxID=3069691 RepID=A0AAU7ZDT7_9BACT
MSSSHSALKYTRLVHLYLGVFIAPALLFFAFTGALQTFSLHETTRGSSYKPPSWAVTLGQIHKKQTTVVPLRKLPPPERSPENSSAKLQDKPSNNSADKQPVKSQSAPITGTQPAQSPSPQSSDAPAPKSHNTLPLKIFFLLVSIGLFISTISGIYMSYKYIRNRGLITAILIAGVVIPILLTIL